MSYYPSDEDKAAISWTIIFALLAALCFVLSSCGEARPPAPVPAPPTVSDDIREIGQTFLRWGGLVLGLGMVLRGVVWVASLGWITGVAGAAAGWIARVLGPFIGLGAVAGGLAVAFGACCVWMADYLAVVICAGIAACVALGVYYWPRIRRWIPARSPSGKA